MAFFDQVPVLIYAAFLVERIIFKALIEKPRDAPPCKNITEYPAGTLSAFLTRSIASSMTATKSLCLWDTSNIERPLKSFTASDAS